MRDEARDEAKELKEIKDKVKELRNRIKNLRNKMKSDKMKERAETIITVPPLIEALPGEETRKVKLAIEMRNNGKTWNEVLAATGYKKHFLRNRMPSTKEAPKEAHKEVLKAVPVEASAEATSSVDATAVRIADPEVLDVKAVSSVNVSATRKMYRTIPRKTSHTTASRIDPAKLVSAKSGPLYNPKRDGEPIWTSPMAEFMGEPPIGRRELLEKHPGGSPERSHDRSHLKTSRNNNNEQNSDEHSNDVNDKMQR